jgi:hypothetical protein
MVVAVAAAGVTFAVTLLLEIGKAVGEQLARLTTTDLGETVAGSV